MTFELEITEPRFAKELRSGFIFIIRDGDRIACHGRIKPSGLLKFGEGSHPFPTKTISRDMRAMAKRYAEDGELPEDRVFADKEVVEETPALADTQPAPAIATDEEPARPKRKPRKPSKK